MNLLNNHTVYIIGQLAVFDERGLVNKCTVQVYCALETPLHNALHLSDQLELEFGQSAISALP